MAMQSSFADLELHSTPVPPVVNSLLAIVVHMCMYFLCRKPVTVIRNLLHAGYEILYLPLVKLLSISTFFVYEKEN